MKIVLPSELPESTVFDVAISRAPKRISTLTENDKKLALQNALRYIPQNLHSQLAPEFWKELQEKGRIYGYRYRPEGEIKAKNIDEYKGCLECRAIQLMMDNNVDFNVALYPYELVTYGETGQVCQNWMQFVLLKKYLEEMNEEQTLVVTSGHPLGLFPTHRNAPRVISTNGLMIGQFDNSADFRRAAAIGVANYGQMTAGGWMYIGPQGIVHGTYITLLNAGRLHLNLKHEENLSGKLFISSGLGGMSGAQPKAAKIAGAVCIMAETSSARVEIRHKQGWVDIIADNIQHLFKIALDYCKKGEATSIAYLGNIVDVLEYANDNNIHIDLISDQTSCHATYEGGYCPQGLDEFEAKNLLENDLEKFSKKVDESLKKHFEIIKKLSAKGSYFWDYGNSFLKSVFDAGVKEVAKNGVDTNEGFIFPSYVEHIMGPMCFDYGYGPFRWVCLSGKSEDLSKTDKAAMSCIDPNRRGQDRDNFNWIKDAEKNNLVVGSQARILYTDAEGRVKIALKFNEMVKNGEIAPIMMGRDHHDTGGTDSPFRETSNILDGSNIMSEMAHQCWAGDIARGMTMCVLSNGGGVGTGRSVNGGFGLVLDGSERVDEIIKSALNWDAMCGVARRNWARNENAIQTVNEWNNSHQDSGYIPVPFLVDSIDNLLK